MRRSSSDIRWPICLRRRSRANSLPPNTSSTRQRQWIALLPGSRRGEVSRIFPILLEAAQLLGPDYVYIVPVASTLDPGWVASFLRDYSGPPITFTRDARATLLHARAAAVASGTSTLEASLIGTPFAMVYQVAPLTWSLGRRLVKVDRFAMVNLIAERDVVPELVQADFTPQRVCAELRRTHSRRRGARDHDSGFQEVRQRCSRAMPAAAHPIGPRTPYFHVGPSA